MFLEDDSLGCRLRSRRSQADSLARTALVSRNRIPSADAFSERLRTVCRVTWCWPTRMGLFSSPQRWRRCRAAWAYPKARSGEPGGLQTAGGTVSSGRAVAEEAREFRLVLGSDKLELSDPRSLPHSKTIFLSQLRFHAWRTSQLRLRTSDSRFGAISELPNELCWTDGDFATKTRDNGLPHLRSAGLRRAGQSNLSLHDGRV